MGLTDLFRRKTEEEKGKVWERMESVRNDRTLSGHCPNCGGGEFLEGPSGGLAVNIECKRCGLRWNANWVGLSWQYIGRREES